MSRLSDRLCAACVCLFLVLCEIGYANGLSCYECTSSDAYLCKDTIDKKNIKPVDCNSSIYTQFNVNDEEFICISTKEEYNGHILYARRCGLQMESVICDPKERVYNMTMCLTCQKDLCNSSANVGFNVLFIVIFILVHCTGLLKFKL